MKKKYAIKTKDARTTFLPRGSTGGESDKEHYKNKLIKVSNTDIRFVLRDYNR